MNAARRPDASPESQARSERLSSFIDGECQPGAADDACRQWPADAALRGDWHLYHLIGDVLRSDELARPASRDAAFLQSLRSRLDAEPVPLAPAPLPVRAKPRRWLAPAAMVAGFAVVGVAVMVLRTEDQGQASGWNERLAVNQPAGAGVMRQVGSAAASASAQALVVDGQVIRDARLDAYFEAHRGAVGARPSAVPGGALRSVEILVPQR